MSTRDDEPQSRNTRESPAPQGIGTHTVDIHERGAERDGEPQVMDRRLFMQLLVYRCDGQRPCGEVITELGGSLDAAGACAVMYDDVGDPQSFGLLSYSEDPGDFVAITRKVLQDKPFRSLVLRPDMTMLGRSYSTGYEPDLAAFILDRPRATVRNPDWPWAVWYPLRRSGAFSRLPGREQGGILREHAVIGRAYGEKDLAHDVRLACHGLDANDNDFVIGLVGKALHPLSHVVQSMRKTRQTSEYITKMGPFFVGHLAWQSKKAQ